MTVIYVFSALVIFILGFCSGIAFNKTEGLHDDLDCECLDEEELVEEVIKELFQEFGSMSESNQKLFLSQSAKLMAAKRRKTK